MSFQRQHDGGWQGVNQRNSFEEGKEEEIERRMENGEVKQESRITGNMLLN